MYQVTADHDLPLILTKWCQNITIKLNHASVAMSGYCIVLYCIVLYFLPSTDRDREGPGQNRIKDNAIICCATQPLAYQDAPFKNE